MRHLGQRRAEHFVDAGLTLEKDSNLLDARRYMWYYSIAGRIYNV
jgi:hypothetical protein